MKVRDPESSANKVSQNLPSGAEQILHLIYFEGPREEFLHALLRLQCENVHARAGAIYALQAESEGQLLAVFPEFEESATQPEWLEEISLLLKDFSATPLLKTKIVSTASTSSATTGGRQHAVLIPLSTTGQQPLVAVCLIHALSPVDLSYKRQRLELTGPLLLLHDMRRALQQNDAAAKTMQTALDVLAETNRMVRFRETAFSLCNLLAAQWECGRVSIGFLREHYVRLEATSHVEKFVRQSDLVQNIEAAMEECLDQDMEVVYPPPPGTLAISRAAAELSQDHDHENIASLPLRWQNSVSAVITLERGGSRSFTDAEIKVLRLTCELVAPRLMNLHEYDRWIGSRIMRDTKKALGSLVGSKHTWVKLLALALLCVTVYLTFATTTYRLNASFVLHATEKQTVAAPFDGFIKSIQARPGDLVEGNKTILGSLDAEEIKLQLAARRAEIVQYKKEAAVALRDSKIAEMKIAEAQGERVAAEANLLRYRVERAVLIAPRSGTVVSEDLFQRVGAPVKLGETLFAIAPLDKLGADLYIAEDLIVDVTAGMRGELAVTGLPERRIPFLVTRVYPAAEVVSQRNVFRVEVELSNFPRWLKPGMEGVAKIDAGRRSFAWIWTRELVSWLRMKLWI